MSFVPPGRQILEQNTTPGLEACLAAETPTITLRNRSLSPSSRTSPSTQSLPSPRQATKPPTSPVKRKPYLPLYQASAALQRLYALVQELEIVWHSMEAQETECHDDTEAIAAPALAAVETCLAARRHQQAELQAKCNALESKVKEAGDAAKEGGSDLTKIVGLPLRQKSSVLEQMVSELYAKTNLVGQLRMTRAELLIVLGRSEDVEEAEGRSQLLAALGRPTPSEEDEIASVKSEIEDLEKEISKRRDAVSQTRDALREIWMELQVKLSSELDMAIDTGSVSVVSDRKYSLVHGRLSFWKSEHAQRLEELSNLHTEISKVAKILKPSEPAGVVGFLERHKSCRDIVACQGELNRLYKVVDARVSELQHRRSHALVVLGNGSEAGCCNQPENILDLFLHLENEVEILEGKVNDRRRAIRDIAERVKSVADDLGEKLGSFDEVVQIALQVSLSEIDAMETNFAAVKACLVNWQALQEAATQETHQLHQALRSFGPGEGIEEFIRNHSSVHVTDRVACKQKLMELQAALQADLEDSDPTAKRLRQLYEISGAGLSALQCFYSSLVDVESVDEWRKRLAEEVVRMEQFYESVKGIIMQLEELKSLVLEGVRFESANKFGEGRFNGNSLHFLEEEKFRKIFTRRYPAIRNKLIKDLGSWEATSQKCFLYHGSNVKESLETMCELENDFVRAPGDLSIVGKLVQLLDVRDMTVKDKNQPSARRNGLPPRGPAPIPSGSPYNSTNSEAPRRQSNMSRGSSRTSSPAPVNVSRSPSRTSSPAPSVTRTPSNPRESPRKQSKP